MPGRCSGTGLAAKLSQFPVRGTPRAARYTRRMGRLIVRRAERGTVPQAPYLALMLVLVVGAAWWLMRPDAESRVRDAHEELRRLLIRSGDEGNASLLSARALQGLFADSCEVSGDAEALTGTYSRDEMVGTIIRVRGIFESIELTFGELEIEFPADDDAVAEFPAVLVGRSAQAGFEDISETRRVTSRMRNVEGSWLFYAFRLERTPPGG